MTRMAYDVILKRWPLFGHLRVGVLMRFGVRHVSPSWQMGASDTIWEIADEWVLDALHAAARLSSPEHVNSAFFDSTWRE